MWPAEGFLSFKDHHDWVKFFDSYKNETPIIQPAGSLIVSIASTHSPNLLQFPWQCNIWNNNQN